MKSDLPFPFPCFGVCTRDNRTSDCHYSYAMVRIIILLDQMFTLRQMLARECFCLPCLIKRFMINENENQKDHDKMLTLNFLPRCEMSIAIDP